MVRSVVGIFISVFVVTLNQGFGVQSVYLTIIHAVPTLQKDLQNH
ncbi:Uncharacterised protein [Yersinia enterocolitica]|nr:Uncharacterised protein [Yersinia enterocolitica]